jgi:hypothetical protein
MPNPDDKFLLPFLALVEGGKHEEPNNASCSSCLTLFILLLLVGCCLGIVFGS